MFKLPKFTKIILLKYCTIIVIVTLFTGCTEYLSENYETRQTIDLPSSVNVMNENLANAKSRTGSDSLAPAIHTSTVSGSDKPIYFRYTTTPGIQKKLSCETKTRGTIITTDNFYDSYSLYTYLYPISDNWSTVATSTNPTTSDEQVLRARNWGTTTLWPGTGVKCAFFAYAPYHATGLSSFTASGWPTFHYTVPSSVTLQSDLLVTQNDVSTGLGDYGNIDVPGNFNEKDYITFDHACTAIRFAIGNQMAPCTIKKIEIKNVYSEGDYQYQTESWTNLSNQTSFNLTQDIIVKSTDSNRVLTDNSNVFMMIPQKVPNDAIISVTINDGEEHVLQAHIGQDNWLKGYTVTYYLSTAEVNTGYVLSISPASTTIPYTGGNDVITINSYKQTYYGSMATVPWTASYTYDDNGTTDTTTYTTTSSAVTAFTPSSTGSITGQNVNFTVAAGGQVIYKSSSDQNLHTKALREAADGSCDLADGKQTANCYVIHAPGHYSFPLVYGNALNGDKTYNTSSYGTPTFVDHQGVQIDNPYIYLTHGGANVPYDACIVWQDAPHLITPSSLKLSSDKHSIEFDVERDNICQGNSVIAVRDKSGNIMWSWHIWVTDYALTQTYEYANNPDVGGAVISKLMEKTLGYCDPDVRVGNQTREFHLTIKQTDVGSETGSINLLQSSSNQTYTYGANAPYYQWGRKDLMLPTNGISNTSKPYYDSPYIMTSLSSSNIKDGILHPNMYLSGFSSFELWNKGNNVTTINNNPVIKTIYDPCPTNYTLPRTAAFTGFTTTLAASYNFKLFGWYQGGVVDFNGSGWYWLSGPSSSGYSYCCAWQSGFNPTYGDNTFFGFQIMPVLE